jgi:allantoinase
VHLNEPGRTEWEGFYTGTRAAASGGVTTVVDMPLNSIPPTTTVGNLEIKRAAAAGQCWVDYAFWGGVIPGNAADLVPLVEANARGFKCFLINSGVDVCTLGRHDVSSGYSRRAAQEFPCVNEADLRTALPPLQAHAERLRSATQRDARIVVAFHAELEDGPSVESTGDPTLYSTFLASRPSELETRAIDLITSLLPDHPRVHAHIVHLSAAPALALVRAAKAEQLRLTAETCFHYLALAAEDIPNGRPEFKCCPPIRDAANQDALWAALVDRTLDFVVSDHSPCIADLKHLDTGDVMAAWGGISTLGLGLSILWTEDRRRAGKLGIGRIMELTALNTARHAGLGHKKGSLAIGCDADLQIWDPEATFTVTKESLNFKNKLSAYVGLSLSGVTHQTYLRGQLAYDRASGFDGIPANGREVDGLQDHGS